MSVWMIWGLQLGIFMSVVIRTKLLGERRVIIVGRDRFYWQLVAVFMRVGSKE